MPEWMTPELIGAVVTAVVAVLVAILRERGKEKAAVWLERWAPIIVDAIDQTSKDAPPNLKKLQAAARAAEKLPTAAKVLAPKSVKSMVDEAIEAAVHRKRLAEAAAGAGE